MTHPLVFSGLISLVANLLIGLFVLSKNPRNRVNILFALFSLTVSGWSVGSFFENVIPNSKVALAILRTNYLFGIWLPPIYIHFIYSLTTITKTRWRVLRVMYLISMLLSAGAYTPWFISGLRLLQVEPYQFFISKPGPLYYVFFLFFVISVSEVLRTSLREMTRSRGERYVQFKYLTIANTIAIAAGYEYFSRVFGLLQSPPVDDYILIVYLLVVAYAILRYQLMDINVVITRTGLLLATYLVVLGAPFLVGWWGRERLEALLGAQWWLVPLGLCTALATAGPFAYAYLRHQAEERLLREQRRYQRTLQRAARGMTQVRNITRLSHLIVRVVSQSVRVSHASLFLWDKVSQRYILRASHGPKRLSLQSRYTLESSDALIRWLQEHHQVLTEEELVRIHPKTLHEAGPAACGTPPSSPRRTIAVVGCDRAAGGEEVSERAGDLTEQQGPPLRRHPLTQGGFGMGSSHPQPSVSQALIHLDAALVVPGLIERHLVGFLVLGEKLSGAGYSLDDLHAFATLANEAAMALENASSYEELLRVNEQLKAAAERLLSQERLAAAGQFATGMAHEIKNPLSAIKTFAEYLPEKYNDPAFREKFFRIVQSEIERVNTLVKELSDFAKPAPLQLQRIHLAELADDTLSLLSNQCLKQGVEVKTSFGENGLMIQADPQQLKQVLLNLFLNSLEAMPNGGRLEVVTQANQTHLALRIIDTGCGISPDQQAEVWDPFFTTKERGMGLGLAIVKGVIERHGGQITLSSAPDRGTSVEISLPFSS